MNHVRTLLLLPVLLASSSALAQTSGDEEVGELKTDIIVTAPRIKGSVDTDLPLDMVLSETDIASYGASSVTDLLAALGNQTQSTRSRGGGGFPITLLNGRRVSGFQEMRDLPPEAIVRVEILPEDVAIRYGFAPGQRVVNFILKENFSSRSIEVETGGPTRGGQNNSEFQTTYLKIGKKGRVNLSAEYDINSSLTEAERAIIPTGADTSGLRTLAPHSEQLQLNGTVSQALTERIQATFNAKFDTDDSHSILGLPLYAMGAPITAQTDRLDRNGKSRILHLGATLDQGVGRWRWTLTGSHDRNRNLTLTDRNSATLGPLLRDSAKSLLTTSSLVGTVDGKLFRMPAGDARLSLRGGYQNQGFTSLATSQLGITTGTLSRRELDGKASLDIPILDRRDGLGRVIGDFSINGNFSVDDLSDFGALNSHGYGFTWSPVEGLSIYGSITSAQAAPSPQQLGNPRVVTPNVSIYDYAKGTTVIASLISGGNPLLLAEEQRDKSISVSVSPRQLKGITLSGTYTAKRSDNLLSGFPSLNVETERAFSGRIVRDAGGNLVSIDQRAVNFLTSRDDTLRWGIQIARDIGKPAAGGAGAGPPRGGFPGGGPGRGPGGGAGPRPGGGGPGGGGGRPGGGFGPMGGQGGRLYLSLYHTLKLNDDIAIAPGLPLLDRLNGSATSFNGGTPRHRLDLEGGVFKNGMGMRLTGRWSAATRVEGGTTAPDLFFSDLATLNLRMFMNFDQRKKLIKSVPFLKGARMSIGIDNVFDAIQSVRDQTGATPLRYQPGYVDPVGRRIEISFRKLF